MRFNDHVAVRICSQRTEGPFCSTLPDRSKVQESPCNLQHTSSDTLWAEMHIRWLFNSLRMSDLLSSTSLINEIKRVLFSLF